jgi:hypothetical protein
VGAPATKAKKTVRLSVAKMTLDFMMAPS